MLSDVSPARRSKNTCEERPLFAVEAPLLLVGEVSMSMGASRVPGWLTG